MILRTCLSIEKGLGQDGVAGWRGKEDLRLAGHGLVRRRHTHVGAPDNRIEALYKEYVLTPRGRDMNPELGPVVAASPERKLSYLWVLSNVILILVIEGQTIGCCPRGTSQEFTCQSMKFR